LAGFVYVAFVVDVFSRRILGWRVTTTKHTGMVTDALRQALQVRRRGEHAWVAAGLIHHSDAGSQYVSVAFTAELIAAGIAGSIGSVGDALDNALCESTIGLFKTEAINPGRPGLDRPSRRRMAGRPLDPLVQHRPAPLLDRAPAPD
jgi:transposase InsO family protein